MNEGKHIASKTVVYALLILGFIFLYVVDIDLLLHPDKEIESKSNVNFIYQQF